MSAKYEFRPLLSLDADCVQQYWQTLGQYAKLQDRFLDVEDPQWEDVKGVIRDHGSNMYCIVEGKTVVGEVQIANAFGMVAQLHFSVHPEKSFKEKISIIATGQLVLMKNPAIASLVGFTPFKHAKFILLHAGWESRGVLNKAVKGLHGNFLDAHVMVYQ